MQILSLEVRFNKFILKLPPGDKLRVDHSAQWGTNITSEATLSNTNVLVGGCVAQNAQMALAYLKNREAVTFQS